MVCSRAVVVVELALNDLMTSDEDEGTVRLMSGSVRDEEGVGALTCGEWNKRRHSRVLAGLPNRRENVAGRAARWRSSAVCCHASAPHVTRSRAIGVVQPQDICSTTSTSSTSPAGRWASGAPFTTPNVQAEWSTRLVLSLPRCRDTADMRVWEVGSRRYGPRSPKLVVPSPSVLPREDDLQCTGLRRVSEDFISHLELVQTEVVGDEPLGVDLAAAEQP